MNIRECTITVCREMGMEQEEIDRFMAFADEQGMESGSTAESANIHVDDLPDSDHELFWAGLRLFIPIYVQRYRDRCKQESRTE